MQKAVIYARYSSDKQTEQSIEGQVRVCKEFAEHEEYEITNVYIDRAKTATTANRPAFQQMIKDAGKHDFKFVIVYKLDRFARNSYDSAYYEHALKKHGVKVISATESLTDNPESIITKAMLISMAEFFSAELAQKTKRGMRESALKCNTTGHIPTGYKTVDKKLVIDESTAFIPRTAFQMYADGKGKQEIAEFLNSKGYRTKRGGLFLVTSFDSMLKNKKYIGIFTYTDIECENGCPPLIEKELFDKVQMRIQRMKKAPATAKAKVNYLLSGKLFCGYCGNPMVGESGRSHSGSVYNYYACRTRKKEKACHKKNERQDFIEWYICKQVIDLFSGANNEVLADKIIKAFQKAFGLSGVEDLECRLKKVLAKQKRIAESIAESGGRKILYDQLDELEAQQCDIEEELVGARMAARHVPAKKELLDWFKKIQELDIHEEKTKEDVINIFVNRVYLYDDKLTIFYNLPNTQSEVSFEEIREHEKALADCSDLECLGVP